MNKVGLRELCSHGSSLFEIAYVPTQVIVCFLSHNGEGDIDLYNCQYENIWKILSGGSLGSYVDEGRSKMREIVWIAGHIEHRYSERKLQSKACLSSTPVWGSLLNHSILVLYKRVCECLHSLILVTTTSSRLCQRTNFAFSALMNDAQLLTSDQTRVLAEFKHIIKRRKRN